MKHIDDFGEELDLGLSAAESVGTNGHGTALLECGSRCSLSAARSKHFVLDTNVLLHDPGCLERFADNHVWIPLDVLSELDRFKNEPSDRGANARAVHRHLHRLFDGHTVDVTSGTPTVGGGSIRIGVFEFTRRRSEPMALQRFRRLFPDLDRIDHRILAGVLMLGEQHAGPAILVTKDLNLLLKARAIGIPCEDYLNDKVTQVDVAQQELRRIEVRRQEAQRLASSGTLDLSAEAALGMVCNEYVLLVDGTVGEWPARHVQNGTVQRLSHSSIHVPDGNRITPLNAGQQCLLDALLDPSISLVTCYGRAGTGKTLLAVAAGLEQVLRGVYLGLMVTRPVVAMGDTLGYLPGTLDEKLRPWLQPVYDALDHLMTPQSRPPAARKKGRSQSQHTDPVSPNPNQVRGRKPYERLMDQGILDIQALCYIRGRSIPKRFFVLDEAQQITPLEAKTVVTRMSKGSKIILIGDPEQIDNPYVDSRSNGLVYTRNRLKGQPMTAHISLTRGERSPLAEAGASLM